MLCKSVCNYINSAKGLPYLYVVGDNDYLSVLQDLKQQGLDVVRISDFCSAPDRFPSIDELIDYFRTADVDFKSNKCVIVGLGEYLALRGEEEANKVLRKLKGTTLGSARVVILLRCVTAQVENVVSDDIRIKDQQRLFYAQDTLSDISLINVDYQLGVVKDKGVKFLLQKLEDGANGKQMVSSDLLFDKSLIQVKSLKEPYDLILHNSKGFRLPKCYGSNVYWTRLAADLKKFNYSLDAFLHANELDDDFDSELYNRINGLEYSNWLYFISLKHYCSKIDNSYLKYAVEQTESFEDFKKKVLTAIVSVSHLDTRHKQFYNERKKLVKGFPDEDIALFIAENKIDYHESIYNYTDNTLEERKAIIDHISGNGIPSNLELIYPALANYLKKYLFSCGALSDELTDYFTEYKLQKVENKISDNFIDKVRYYAKSLKYTHLKTRDNVINALDDKKSTSLVWIDALGVEYLSYFVELARQKGLAINIDVARADLPTITSINKQFYEDWQFDKRKFSDLDDYKHKDVGGFNFESCETPIHLASELALIDRVVGFASTELAMHRCKKVVIASDHGASRLAVLFNQEEKYETDTKGEHSGRCCKQFDNDLEYAISENGYTILADYGRFKGSRKANVEVHGGASLEEVVVPIITLSLKTSGKIDIRLLNKDAIFADVKNGASIEVYISDIINKNNVRIIVKDTQYMATCKDSTHFAFNLTNIKRSGTYNAELYDGDSLIGSLEIKVKGKAGNIKSDFDDLF